MKLLTNALLVAGLCPYVMTAPDKQFDVTSETLLRSSSAWNGISYEMYSKGAPELQF